jgi:hypothetical protein
MPGILECPGESGDWALTVKRSQFKSVARRQ